MREFKFRAWDGERMVNIAKLPPLPFKSRHEDVEYMQYTGLKDKNGVEIYEGDILHTEHPDDDSIGSVEFIAGEFNRTITPTPMYPKLKYNAIWTNQSEVIGNIYEHPALLEPTAEIAK